MPPYCIVQWDLSVWQVDMARVIRKYRSQVLGGRGKRFTSLGFPALPCLAVPSDRLYRYVCTCTAVGEEGGKRDVKGSLGGDRMSEFREGC